MVTTKALTQLIHNVDISRHPKTHIDPKDIALFNDLSSKEKWSTIGDLHANPLKLLYFMIIVGAVDISEEDYKEFAATFQKEQNANPKVDYSKMKVAQHALIRLIGDELADRAIGGDDFVLEMTEAFKQGGGILESILSNHTAVFIHVLEIALRYANQTGTFDEKVFLEHFTNADKWPMQGEFVASLQSLADKLKSGQLSVSRLLALYNFHKESFKAFAYDYADNKELIIFSHAPISRYHIVNIASEMFDHMTDEEIEIAEDISTRIPLFDHCDIPFVSDEDLISLIDIINRIVTTKIKNNELSTLYIIDRRDSLFFESLQNRLNPSDNTIHNIHGHTPLLYGNRETLDNLLGHKVLDRAAIAKINNLVPGSTKDMYALSFTKTWPSLAARAKAQAAYASSTKTPLLASYPKERPENAIPTQDSRWRKLASCLKCF